jgi:hypothetical protein
MSVTTDLQAFTQSVYLVIKGRYFDDIATDDGDTLIAQTIDWTNMFLDELESEQDSFGDPINWYFARSNGETLGRARLGAASIDFDTDFANLIAEEGRYVQVLQDGAVVSNFAVVSPGQITNQSDRVTEDMCALVGTSIVFSRQFRDTEAGGTIIGDVTLPLPRLSLTNVDVLTTVKPKLLLILGVAKNASLPDIVKGKLSPNYAQKFNDLLQNAIAKNEASSAVDAVVRDDLGYIHGVGF